MTTASVLAGEYVPEHNMYVLNHLDSDQPRRALIFSDWLNRDPKTPIAIAHSKRFFVCKQLPQEFELEIIGIPWEPAAEIAIGVEASFKQKDQELFDYMEKTRGWTMAVIDSNDNLFIDRRINSAPDAIERLLMFIFQRRCGKAELGPNIKQIFLHYHVLSVASVAA